MGAKNPIGLAMAHVLRCKPNTLETLQCVVNNLALNFDPQKALTMVRNVRYIGELCKSQSGGHFEDLIRHQSSREECELNPSYI